MLSHAERRVAVISPPIYRQRETQKIRLIPPLWCDSIRPIVQQITLHIALCVMRTVKN